MIIPRISMPVTTTSQPYPSSAFTKICLRVRERLNICIFSYYFTPPPTAISHLSLNFTQFSRASTSPFNLFLRLFAYIASHTVQAPLPSFSSFDSLRTSHLTQLMFLSLHHSIISHSLVFHRFDSFFLTLSFSLSLYFTKLPSSWECVFCRDCDVLTTAT